MEAGAVDGGRLFLWAWLFSGVVGLLFRVALSVLPYLIDHLGASDAMWSLRDWFGLLGTASSVIGLLGLGGCAFGLILYGRGTRPCGVTGRVTGALVCCLVSIAISLLYLVVFQMGFSDGVRADSFWAPIQRHAWIVGVACEIVMPALFLLAAARVSAKLGQRLGRIVWGAALAGLAVELLIVLARSLFSFDLQGGLGFRSLLVIAGVIVNLGVLVLGWFLLSVHLGHLRRAGSSKEPGGEEGAGFRQAPWPTVRWGLTAYRAGLLAKLSLVLVGLGLLVLALIARSAEFGRVVLVLLGVAAPLTTAWMIAGLVGYAQVPAATGGRPAAVIALLILTLGLLGDFFGLTLVVRLFSSDPSDIYKVVDLAPWVEGASQALGILGVMALLFSFGRVGRFAGDVEIGARVGRVAVLLVGLAGAAFGLKALIAKRVIRGLWPLPLGIGVLLAAIVGLVWYLGLLKRLRRAIGAHARSSAFD